MDLLVLAHLGCPGQSPESRKMVVCVCVCTERIAMFTLFTAVKIRQWAFMLVYSTATATATATTTTTTTTTTPI